MEHNHQHDHDHEHCHCHEHEHQPMKESKYEAMLKKYRTDLDDNEVKDLVFPLLEKHLAENNTLEVKKFLFN